MTHLDPPSQPNPVLKTAAGRSKIVGKSLDEALSLVKGYPVAAIYRGELGLVLDKNGKVTRVVSNL